LILGTKSDSNPNSASISCVRHSTNLSDIALSRSEDDKITDMKDKMANLQQKNEELTNEISNLKLQNENLRMELVSSQQKWIKDKDDLLHKVRQDEKIRNVELDALQQKFASRMRIMEDTNKSLHSQLVQARRERDYHREALYGFEKKVSEEQRRDESDQRELESKYVEMSKQIQDLSEEVIKLTADLKLSKEAHDADRSLWKVERSNFRPNRSATLAVVDSKRSNNELQITESALKAAETVQKKYAEYEKFYAKEVERLNRKIKDLSNDILSKRQESEKTIKDLREQIKVLEISQRNLMEARDMQSGAKEFLETELEKLQEMINLNEVHRLTRKYKISSIIEQLQLLTESLRRIPKTDRDTISKTDKDVVDVIKTAILQLKNMKEEEYQLLTIRLVLL
uniref:FIP-RBD domain-containing protein n=1 Tax=Thelazia callipaeda TaxID=103827 RepID=A0A0N5CSS8_THECL